jgi:hypothetical protein
MNTRRFLVPVATAAAVVAIAAGATVVAGRDDDTDIGTPLGSPTLPALAISGGRGVAMAASDSSAEGADKKIGVPAPGSGIATVTIKGTLPEATEAPVKAYRLVRRPPTREDAVRLAALFGLEGEPRQQALGWTVSDAERVVTVHPGPTVDWQMFQDPARGSNGTVAPDQPVSSDASCSPPGAQTLVACPPTPGPTAAPKPLPTVDAARAAALELLKKLGHQAEPADAHVEEQGHDGLRQVIVRPRVGKQPTDGMFVQVGVDADGVVVNASGQLAEPVAAGQYPMLPPAELAQSIANTRMYTMVCEQKEGVEGCAPPPPIVVTGARAGLSLAYPSDPEKGDAFLLPAWLFSIEGEAQPTAVVAVPAQYPRRADTAGRDGRRHPGARSAAGVRGRRPGTAREGTRVAASGRAPRRQRGAPAPGGQRRAGTVQGHARTTRRSVGAPRRRCAGKSKAADPQRGGRFRRRSGRLAERVPAGAGSAGVRVVDREPLLLDRVDEVDARAAEVRRAHPVDDHLDTAEVGDDVAVE